MKNLLEVDSVIISFDQKNILTDCFLKCETNDIIGILGRNGCGKSSLLKVIFGTLFTNNKFIRIKGKVYNQPYKSVTWLPIYPSMISCLQIFLSKALLTSISNRLLPERK